MSSKGLPNGPQKQWPGHFERPFCILGAIWGPKRYRERAGAPFFFHRGALLGKLLFTPGPPWYQHHALIPHSTPQTPSRPQGGLLVCIWGVGQRTAIAGEHSVMAGPRTAIARKRTVIAGKRAVIAGSRTVVAGKRTDIAGKRAVIAGKHPDDGRSVM